jgi:6-pyruvoyltetrahydropterin/6-carboxytetrahydropterin synthase
MYKLVIKSDFSSAHQLRQYHGKCENLHGHNWNIEVILLSDSLDKTGMAIDFHEAKRIILKVISKLDHAYLNDLKEFKKDNPTTENIARIMHQKLAPLFAKKKIKVDEVGIWESAGCGAYYKP